MVVVGAGIERGRAVASRGGFRIAAVIAAWAVCCGQFSACAPAEHRDPVGSPTNPGGEQSSADDCRAGRESHFAFARWRDAQRATAILRRPAVLLPSIGGVLPK